MRILATVSDRPSEKDPLHAITPILRSKGVRLDPIDFHNLMNQVFHDAEADVYDEVHADMWTSLPRQFELVVSDALKAVDIDRSGLSLLDVGCGTGLSTELLLQTPLGHRVERITLLDTSESMLAKAGERAARWGRPTELSRSPLRDLTEAFDVIVICSVLHHVPDIAGFLRELPRKQRPGGLFLHLQDPNGSRDISIARRREKELARATRRRATDHIKRLTPRRILNRLRGVSKPRRAYIERVNEILMSKGAIARSLTAEEVWRITDLHVYSGKGVSLEDISGALPEYRLIAARSYSYFGRLESALPTTFRVRERELSDAGDLNGRELAAAWLRT